ncbi:Proteasome assembly chaperone 2 [Halotydeus destructor]|nr:Proteasome assembly chaperone 2 [Halotydeus destructor]
MAIEQFFVAVNQQQPAFKGRTLVLPCVSVGNVGQLAIDLLASTLLKSKKLSLVGRIRSNAFRPVVGPNPFELSDKLMTTAEVYDSPEMNVTVMQIRSPCYHDKRQSFLDNLVDWIKSSQFAKVILLSSTYSQFLSDLDASEQPNPVRQFANFELDAGSQIKQVTKVERYSHRPDENGMINIPGSGLTKKLFDHLNEAGLSTLALVKYCSEGDNSPDAVGLVEALNTIVPVKQRTSSLGHLGWDIPISWNKLFGGDAPLEVY